MSALPGNVIEGPWRSVRWRRVQKWWPVALLLVAALAFTLSWTMLNLGTSVADLWIVTLLASCVAGGVGGSFTYIRWRDEKEERQ